MVSVVLVSRLVVQEGALLEGLFEGGQGDPSHSVGVRLRGGDSQLQAVEGDARVAVRHGHEVAHGLGRQLRLQRAQTPVGVAEGALGDEAKLVVLKLPQGEDTGPREQGSDDLKGGVLRRRADEDNRAVLDVGEDDVLLGLVEAVDLIDEEDGALGVHGPPLLRCLGDAAEVGHAGGDGGDGLEVGAGEAGDEVRKGGLAGARRAPQQQRGDLVRFDGAAEDAARPQRRGPARRTRRRSAGACGRPGGPPARCGRVRRGRRGSCGWGLWWGVGEHDGA